MVPCTCATFLLVFLGSILKFEGRSYLTRECPPGKFGWTCHDRCACFNASEVCNHLNGACKSGCAPGRLGDNCLQRCPYQKFGWKCLKDCHCTYESHGCDPHTGSCKYGCDKYHMGDDCQECADGRFGKRCWSACRCVNRSEICNKRTGACSTDECIPGFITTDWQKHCSTQCPWGKFGRKCLHRCTCQSSVYVEDETCNFVTGSCRPGCAVGGRRINCYEQCNNGTFGRSCKYDCACFDRSEVCHKKTGKCKSGCMVGRTGDDCQKIIECDNGTFGQSCKHTCACFDRSEVCHKLTGKCKSGCMVGRSGADCLKQCNDGSFGISCVHSCACFDRSEVCHKRTGKCKSGCMAGRTGADCLKSCPGRTYGRKCMQSCACLDRTEVCDKRNGKCKSGCMAGRTGDNCQKIYRLIVEGLSSVNEGSDLRLKCSESNRRPWVTSALKWYRSKYDGTIIGDVETDMRYSVRRCSNRTHPCLTMVIDKAAWYDNSSYFLCCSGSSNQCRYQSLMNYAGHRYKTLKIVVRYISNREETKKVFYGENEKLKCPINIKHRNDITIKWKKIGSARTLTPDSRTVYKFRHQDTKTSSYTCEAKNEIQTSDNERVTNHVKHTFKVETLYKDKLSVTMKNLTNLIKKDVKHATLNCTVRGARLPINRVKWYKDGRPVKGQHSTKVGDDFLLKPYNVYGNDISGMYRCEVKEGTKTDEVSAEIIVNGILKVKLKRPRIMDEGKEYTFTCETSGFPKADKFFWHLEGNLVHLGYNGQYVTKATRDKGGVYSCTAMNKYGNGTDKREVEVRYRPHVKVANVTVAQGGSAKITCTIMSNPNIKKIVWKHNDKTIGGKNDEILIIQSVKYKDSGLYKCIVTNELGQGHGTGLLTVVDSAFVAFPRNQEVMENTTVTLPCGTKDLKKMGDVRIWYKDDQIITNKERVMRETSTYSASYHVKESTSNYPLVITNIKFRHRGKYTCEMGIKTVSAKVAVKVPPKQPVLNVHQSYKKGDNATMSCTSKIQNVYPIPALWWYQNGHRLEKEYQNTYVSKEKKQRLYITPAVRNNGILTSVLSIFLHEKDHKSIIACGVENAAGSKKRSATLNVTFAPIIQPLGKDRLVTGGTKFQLTCNYTANPTAKFLGWYKLQNSTSYKIHDSPILIIEKAKATDSGTYTCKVGNTHGAMTKAIMIDVVGSLDNILPPPAEGSSLGMIIGGIMAAIVVLGIIPIVFFCRKKSVKMREIFLGFQDNNHPDMGYGAPPLAEHGVFPHLMSDPYLEMSDVTRSQPSKASISLSVSKRKKKRKKKKGDYSTSHSATVSTSKKKRKRRKQKKKEGSKTSLSSIGSAGKSSSRSSVSKSKGDSSVSEIKSKKKKKRKKKKKSGSATSVTSEKSEDNREKRRSRKKGGSATSVTSEKSEDNSEKKKSRK